jgi:hypothetical protein
MTDTATTTLPKVYIVAGRREDAYTGDLGGALHTADGELLWSHVSSTTGWLRRDLTTGFTDRKRDLERRYPDGYDVVWLAPGDPLPWEDAADAEIRQLRAQIESLRSVERQLRHVGECGSLMPYPALRRAGTDALAVADLIRDALDVR